MAGAAAGVNAGRLLAELNENWRLYGKGDAQGVLRACSMTLVVVAHPGEDPQELGQTLASIMREYPNRTIVLRVDGSPTVEARTTIQCWMPFGRQQQVCCEQIEIDSPRESLSGIPPVLMGLMVADLPVAVWCRDVRLAAVPELAPVLRLAGKVMVDTSTASQSEALAGLRALRGHNWRLADLAWTRITRWRQPIARELDKCRGVGPAEVTYAGSGTPMAAIYLARWLQSVSGLPAALRCEDPAPPAPGMGRIRSVRIGSLTMRRSAPTAVVTQCGPSAATAVFPLLNDADLLREELGVFGRDDLFDAVLSAVLED
jgi:glucose-6-phosphate dehydrogenase assembly protein OpcA